MQKTITIKAYSLDELDEGAREKAISDYRELIDLEPELEFMKESFEETLEEKGFENPSVSFSLNYSQGDGVSFTAEVNVDKLFKAHPELEKEHAMIKKLVDDERARFYIRRRTDAPFCHYLHKHTVTEEYDIISDLTHDERSACDAFLDALENLKNYLCGEFEDNGYEEIEYQTSDERIEEEIKELEILFNIDGSRLEVIK